MTQLTPEQFKEYLADPSTADAKVRKWAKVPEDRYYTVSVWPEHLAGRVFVRMSDKPCDHRRVPAKKISKSDQS